MSETLALHAPALVILLPLLTAPLCFLFSRAANGVWATALLVSLLSFLCAAFLLEKTFDGRVLSYHFGGFPPPLGIEYRIDMMSALMLLIVAGASLLGLLFARRSVARELPAARQSAFYVCYLLCASGLLGVAATNDAFNMFVFLEISSLAAYALIALGGDRDRRALSAAYNYLIMGTIGATFFVIGVFFLYAATGTLNMTDLADRLHALPVGSRSLYAAEAFIIVGLALKIALFPLHVWLPNAYAFAPSAATVFLSAAAAKVAIYALVRFLFSVFGLDFAIGGETLNAVILPTAMIGMIIGSFSAIFARHAKRIFAYSSIAQLGYMMLGIGLESREGLEASFVYLFNHALAKSAIFMALGCIAYQQASMKLSDLHGIARDMPWTMAAFTIAALSLIGAPLTGGFIGKWLLMDAALAQGFWLIALVIAAVSLMAVLYVWRVIEAAYLKAPTGRRRGAPRAEAPRREAPFSMLLPLWIAALLSVYFGVDTRLPVGAAEIIADNLEAAGQ